MRTKVAILKELNEPLIVDEVDIPKLQVGQVLVDIYKSGICGAQIGEITGAKGEDKFLPHLLGHEGAGVVLDVGEGVTNVKEGDHVVAHWRKGKGIEAPFPKYGWRGGGNPISSAVAIVGGGNVTTFAEKAIISENRLTVVNSDIPFEYGALMGCAMTTALGLINNEAKLKIGESILVLGCGGVGLNIIQGAKMVSGNPIVAVDKDIPKLLTALKFGATDTIDTTETEYLEIAKNKYDVVVDTTGNPYVIEAGWQSTRSRMILVGQPHAEISFTFKEARDNFYTGKVMMDSQGGMTNPNVDIPRYLDLYEDRRLSFDGIISHTYDLDNVNEAIEKVKSGESIRCMLNTQ